MLGSSSAHFLFYLIGRGGPRGLPWKRGMVVVVDLAQLRLPLGLGPPFLVHVVQRLDRIWLLLARKEAMGRDHSDGHTATNTVCF